MLQADKIEIKPEQLCGPEVPLLPESGWQTH